MNDETDKAHMTPERVAQLQKQLMEHKETTELSWSVLATRTGVPQGTLSAWGPDNYAGNKAGVALKVHRYFNGQASQAELALDAPTAPGYQPTPTSEKIVSLLRWAQRGKLVAIACGSGLGKTTTINRYAAFAPNVWIATMAPSTRGGPTMTVEVLSAMGERDAKGSPQMLSRRVRERVMGTGGLIAIDEAQHLSEQALEEVRAWHDATGIGIALLGNEQVIQRIEGGPRRAAFAQLYSRVSMRIIQAHPTSADATVLATAWGIDDEKMLGFLRGVAKQPGGLRGMSMTLELASILAFGEQRAVAHGDLEDAWAQLSSRPLAA